MNDISIAWSPAISRGDWTLRGSQLQSGNDLVTAVLLSIFTDRVANPDDLIPDGTGDPRGWWGDDPRAPIGSRLWLLSRSKQTTTTLSRAQGYIAECLKWLIDDGVVARFDISTEWMRSGQLGARIIAYQSSGEVITLNSSAEWGFITTPSAPTPQGLNLTFFGA